MRRLRWACTLAAAVWLSGCALLSPAGPGASFDAPAEAIELDTTPFFAQTAHHCGPAALATLLGAAGVHVEPDELAQAVYVPGREGSLQAEMLATARQYDRLPLRLAPTADALIDALRAGQPVLVLQNLGLRHWPAWHYAVVIGYLPESGDFLLRSGTERRQQMSARRFLDTWARADRWAFVLATPDVVPTFADAGRWLAAAAPFETLGAVDTAGRAYRAAVERWPDAALAWQALANARYAQHDAGGAEAALRRALELDPAAAAARNNLASLLLERGCPGAARSALAGLGAVPPELAAVLADTRAQIDAAGGNGEAANCPN